MAIQMPRIVTAVLASLFVLVATDASAISAWARKYRTSCATCHAPFPKLNHVGKAFRNNGYRFPAALEETATKEPPVVMGAEGYKKLFPRALWPSDIPGTIPLAVRGISRLNWFENDSQANFTFVEFWAPPPVETIWITDDV